MSRVTIGHLTSLRYNLQDRYGKIGLEGCVLLMRRKLFESLNGLAFLLCQKYTENEEDFPFQFDQKRWASLARRTVYSGCHTAKKSAKYKMLGM